MRSATALALAGLTLLCAACPPGTSAPACSSGATCPSGQACVSGTCQTLSQLSRNFAVVVRPAQGDLLPQEFLGVDPTEGPNDFTLDLPASFNVTIPIPPICTPGEALPLALRVDRHPLLPITNPTSYCLSDAVGTFSCALPANQAIDVAMTTALPCAAGGIQLDRILSPGPVDPAAFGLLPPAQTLTIVGTLSAPGPDGEIVALTGASVTLLAAGGPRAGQPISATVITAPRNATCSGLQVANCSTVGFVVPVALDQVLLDGGGCMPPTDSASCPLDGGCPFSPCATLVLEVGPSTADGGQSLPSIDFLVQRQITPVDSVADATAGPTLSLMGDSQLGVQLPVGPGITKIEGIAYDPASFFVIGALAQLQSTQSLGACLGQPLVASAAGVTLCSYATRTVTDSMGGFSMEAPAGAYRLTMFPPASQPTLAPHTSVFAVQSNGLPPTPNQGRQTLGAATFVQGRVVDPLTQRPLASGQIRVFPLNSEEPIGTTAIDHGNFSLYLPPTTSASDLILFEPPPGLGFAESSRMIEVPQDKNLSPQAVSPGVPISGAVFVRALDGSRRPVASASVSFYLLYASGAEFPIAVPAANAVTDSVGRYATVVPSVPPQ